MNNSVRIFLCIQFKVYLSVISNWESSCLSCRNSFDNLFGYFVWTNFWLRILHHHKTRKEDT